MAKFIKHPVHEYKINLSKVSAYNIFDKDFGKTKEREEYTTYYIRFYFSGNEDDYLLFTFDSPEHRDKCLKEIDDLLLTK
jgi:hypothetical protein